VSTVISRHRDPASAEGREGLADLWRLWRNESDDPESFYGALAERAVLDLQRWFGPVEDQLIADIGCGPGWYTAAMRAVGAEVIPIDHDIAALEASGQAPAGAIVGDAMDLPLADASVDGVFASNMLEHTPEPERVIAEIARVLRPGGWAYVSWTNWFSPWGGHDMTPYHFLGPRLGLRMYRRRHGQAPKCVYGVSLWPVHIGPTLRFIRSRPELQVVAVEPRYWPSLKVIVDIPLVREVGTWNCVVRLRRWSPDTNSAPVFA
jgi:SAM-dependent methyltransferase